MDNEIFRAMFDYRIGKIDEKRLHDIIKEHHINAIEDGLIFDHSSWDGGVKDAIERVKEA